MALEYPDNATAEEVESIVEAAAELRRSFNPQETATDDESSD